MRVDPDRSRGMKCFVGLAGLSVLAAKLSATRPASAAAVLLLPLLMLSVMAPAVPMTTAVALLPFQSDNFGIVVGGLIVGPSDALLIFGVGGVVIGVLSGARLGLEQLRPLAPYIVAYFSALTLAWAHLPTTDGLATILQRTELIAGAIIAGGYLAFRGHLDVVLQSYLAATAVLAFFVVLYGLSQGAGAETFLGVQKNPAGQVIANGLLIVLFHRRVPFRIPFMVLFALGLIAAQSRGAILATIVAIALATVLTSPSRRVRSLAALPIVVGVAFLAYSTLPPALQQRLTTDTTDGDVATETREVYAANAIEKFKEEPILGTGVGRYESGEVADGTYTIDPHNVVLLEAAEGGLVLLGGFGVLTLGSIWVLFRRRKDHPIAVVAIAVQVSTVLHGIVDVYWVRGTPVLAWLLVSAALINSYSKGRPVSVREAQSREVAGPTGSIAMQHSPSVRPAGGDTDDS